MVRRLFDFSAPDRFVADAIGEPGRRTFYLQARQGSALLTVVLEKTQLAALTGLLADVLEMTAISSDSPEQPQAPVRDDGPLQQPIAEAFRVGVMALAWDATSNRVVIEAQPAADGGDGGDAKPGDMAQLDLLRVQLSAAAARDFVRRAAGLVAGGRPLCPFCGQPLEPSGHFCPRLSLN